MPVCIIDNFLKPNWKHFDASGVLKLYRRRNVSCYAEPEKEEYFTGNTRFFDFR